MKEEQEKKGKLKCNENKEKGIIGERRSKKGVRKGVKRKERKREEEN